MKIVMKPTIKDRIEKELRAADERHQLNRISHVELSHSEWATLIGEVPFRGPVYRIAYMPRMSSPLYVPSVNAYLPPISYLQFDVELEGTRN